ncbi:hypothetical protein ACWZJV_20945 [Nocardioides sp. WG-D5]
MTDSEGRLVPPPIAPSAHLDDDEIAGVTRRPDSDKHLADCAWCRSRLARFEASDGPEGLSDLFAELAERPISKDDVRVASQWAMPARLASLLETEPAGAPAVAAGQMWRLSWRGEQALVVIVYRDHWTVRVMPVTTDVALADEYSLLLEGSDLSLGSAAAVFGRAGANVPTFTLSRFLGDVTVRGTSIRSALRTLDAACMRGRQAGADVPTGPELQPADWETHELLDSLQEQMQWFSSAVTDVSDFSHAAEPESGTAEVDIRQALVTVARKGGVAELADRTGIAMGKLLDLMNGRSQPSGREASILSAALGRPVASAMPQAARTALIEVVAEPSVRPFRVWFNEHEVDASADAASVAPLVAKMWEQGVAARTSSASDDDEGWRRRWRAQLAYLQSQSGNGPSS